MHAEWGDRRLRQILVERSGESGLDKGAIDSIVENAQLAYYDPGQTITKPGRGTTLTCIVISGVAKMVFQGPRPEPMILRFVRAGDSLISIDEHGLDPAFSSVAHTHCGVAFVAHTVVAAAVARMDEPHRRQFNVHSWTVLSALVRDRCELLSRNVRQRLLHELNMLARGFGTKHPHGTMIDLPLKQDELAQLVVVDRSTLNRTLRELESDGLVHRTDHRYILTEAAAAALSRN